MDAFNFAVVLSSLRNFFDKVSGQFVKGQRQKSRRIWGFVARRREGWKPLKMFFGYIILENSINEEEIKNEQVMMNTNAESQELEANTTDIKVLTLFVQFGAPFLWPEAHGQGSIWAPPREREQLQ